MVEICKEIMTKNKEYKAIIYKIGRIYQIRLFKYFPECIDDTGDVWEEFWQDVTNCNTITDTEQNAIKLAEEGLSLFK